MSELVACAVGGGSGLIAFAFDQSQPLLGHLLQRRSLGHCFPVFAPGLCEFTLDLREFAAGAGQSPGLLGGDLLGFAERRDVELLGPDVLPGPKLGTGRGRVASDVTDRGAVVSVVPGRRRRHATVVSERGTHPAVACRMRPRPGPWAQRAADGSEVLGGDLGEADAGIGQIGLQIPAAGIGVCNGCDHALGKRLGALDVASTDGIGRHPLRLDRDHEFRMADVGGEVTELGVQVHRDRDRAEPEGDHLRMPAPAEHIRHGRQGLDAGEESDVMPVQAHLLDAGHLGDQTPGHLGVVGVERCAQHPPSAVHEDPRGRRRGRVDHLGVVSGRDLPRMDEHLDGHGPLGRIRASAGQGRIEVVENRRRTRLEGDAVPLAQQLAHGRHAAGVAQTEEHGLVEHLADMSAHELVEVRLPGEPVVPERIDDERDLEGGERLG